MLFGLTNVSRKFMQFMIEVFPPYIGKFVFIYLVDIQVFSWSKGEHTKHLRLVI
jgi:hypothetical protein